MAWEVGDWAEDLNKQTEYLSVLIKLFLLIHAFSFLKHDLILCKSVD